VARWNYTPLKTLRRSVERHGVTVRQTDDGRYLVRKFQPFAEREAGASWLRLRRTIGIDPNDHVDEHAGGWIREFEIDPRWLTDARLPSIHAMAQGLTWMGGAEVCRGTNARLLGRIVADPTWLSATVISVARAIDAEQAIDRIPILGDALEEAGCQWRVLLDHCRKPGDHVRDCWVVGLVLGKS
jgi:hypothetical protein